MSNLYTAYHGIGIGFLAYLFLYNTLNLFFLVLSFQEVRRRVIGRGFDDLDFVMSSPFTPPISIIVPSYNEEKTIVETVHSLINLKFPRMELIIVNDGSTDSTLATVKNAFHMKRTDIDYFEGITTARVKGFYEAKMHFPERLGRVVLVDKENGGKADALNAGINASRCPYFVSIDADAIIDEHALLQAFRTLLDHENIVAIGGQVAIVNGSEVRGGRVIAPRLPERWLVRFQIVEYLRAFTLARTALARLEALLIISGVFGIFRKDFVQKVGGYLTKNLTAKIAHEYTGSQVETVCEDMEIIVRMHRYIQEKRLSKRISYLPHPLCWTEVPENIRDLSKQRNRWQRGFLETMIFHRKMLFNRGYGRIGLFAFPYFLIFELFGVLLEFSGYVTLPVLFYWGGLNIPYLMAFFLLSVLYGVLISVGSIVVSAWPQKTSESDLSVRSLIYFRNLKDIAELVVFGVLENFGYRQMTVWWRMKAFFDFLRGKRDWDKFERIGFETHVRGQGKDVVPAA